jgi:TPR repeat protein
MCFHHGFGVAVDYAEAVRFYRLAAAQGHAQAQLWLALMFEGGDGVAEDAAEAARLWILAAEQGLATAQLNIGAAFAHGQGVAQDNTQAARWLCLAVAQGEANISAKNAADALQDLEKEDESVAVRLRGLGSWFFHFHRPFSPALIMAAFDEETL